MVDIPVTVRHRDRASRAWRGTWACPGDIRPTAANSASRGRRLTGKPVTESNLILCVPAQRPAVRRSSSGLHDALAECSRSDITGGCCATYCCATPFGTSVLSPRQDVVR